MVLAYKEHSQFILILAIMYILGVWGGPIIYPVYPVFLILFGLKKRYFELLIVALWTLILSDYVPVDNATYDDLQFAKDLKPLVPLVLFGFFMRDRAAFQPFPKLLLYFIPFLLIVTLGLTDSLNFQVGLQKTVSFVLIYLTIPMYVVYLHRQYEARFWKALLTFIIGMLTIGLVLGLAVPEIGMKVGRFKGVLGNPNGLGLFLNLTFVMWILIRKFKLASFTRRENGVIIFVILVSLIWTGSRNGMMSMFLFYVVYRTVQLNWFIAILLVVAFVSFQDQIFEVFLFIIQFFGLGDFFRVDSIEAGSGRTIAWQFALTKVQDYFFIGGGFGHDEHIMRPNYRWLSQLGHSGGVHNSYISMWLDSGILGLLAYFGAILTILIKVMKDNYIIIAFVVSIAFNITFESWLVASLNPFTTLYLIILTIFISNLKGVDYQKEEPILVNE